jgi:glycyl-tRNA synthetase beta subunit
MLHDDALHLAASTDKSHAPQDVADAIFESILPRTAHDILPSSPAGIVVSCTDRIDSLVGLTAVDALPSASADPFGMRRTVYGLLQTLIHNAVHVSMRELIDASADMHMIDIDHSVKEALLDFYRKRLEQLLLDQGAFHDPVVCAQLFPHSLLRTEFRASPCGCTSCMSRECIVRRCL